MNAVWGIFFLLVIFVWMGTKYTEEDYPRTSTPGGLRGGPRACSHDGRKEVGGRRHSRAPAMDPELGAEAEVLEPVSLRNEIRDELQSLLDQLERWDLSPDQPFLPMLELETARN